MNVLTDEDAKEIHRVLCATVGADYLTIAKAASDFTIKKLAAGVSVEPVAAMFAGEDAIKFNRRSRVTLDDKWHELFTIEQLAAARVQENERCLAMMDAIGCDWRDAGDMAKFYATNYLREAIRALLGDKTCTSDEWLANCPQSVRDLADKIKGEKA